MKKQAPEPLSGKAIWIVGPTALQNDLLADLLERKTGAKCAYGETLAQVLSSARAKTSSGLVLFDCLGREPERCMEWLDREDPSLARSHLVAFFNLTRGLGVESRALRGGVRGFFYVKDLPAHIEKGVRTLFEGELWVSREIMARCLLEERGGETPHPKGTHGLTSREIEILSLIAIGSTNEVIAEKLFISVNTVKTHVYNLFHKINVPNRLQAALWAAKNL